MHKATISLAYVVLRVSTHHAKEMWESLVAGCFGVFVMAHPYREERKRLKQMKRCYAAMLQYQFVFRVVTWLDLRSLMSLTVKFLLELIDEIVLVETDVLANVPSAVE